MWWMNDIWLTSVSYYFISKLEVVVHNRTFALFSAQVLKTESLCVNLRSVRTHAVGRAQPIPVVIYDYYNPGTSWTGVAWELLFYDHDWLASSLSRHAGLVLFKRSVLLVPNLILFSINKWFCWFLMGLARCEVRRLKRSTFVIEA